ncbi:MAG: Gfo/Idh/MocA family protein [Haloglomus sp.]
MPYDVAFVGTGADPEDPDTSGFAMAYHHADAYEALDDCTLVACADIVPENAAAFAEAYGLSEDHTYEDYEAMVTEVDPDVVSVCVPPAIHAEVVVDCVRAGDPAAIHCEKPMDLTWGGARRMAQAAWRRDVQLTFNHQRRFKPSWVAARERIDDGAIGDLERVEMAPPNLYDWGTHAIDFAGDVVGDRPAEWAIGQIDYRERQYWFGAHNENQAYGLWTYENGVEGVVSTGEGADLVPAFFRFVGSEGVLDLEPDEASADGGEGDESEAADLRWRRHGDADWERESVTEGEWTDPIDDAIADVVRCVGTDEEPTLSARNALNATEIIFGVWESARRRGRVEFPLEIDDNPLHDMVESGALNPEPAGE